jgi:NAD(P)-dependent dehydrogenase (short-subunit alcohol dehydrogenase family)
MFVKGCSIFFVIVAIVLAVLYQLVVVNPISFQPVDLTGKIAVVTGGSSGIGVETVRKLVEWNATVIMPVRSLAKGEIIRKDILLSVPNSLGKIELMEMDLASFSSVRSFAEAFEAKHLHVDILILNAVYKLRHEKVISRFFSTLGHAKR